MTTDRPFADLAAEVQAMSERLQTLGETFAGKRPMYFGTAREALFLARCALGAVQRQLDAADFLRLAGWQNGDPMDPMAKWAYEKTIEITGGKDLAHAFTAWMIAAAVSLPQLYEDAGSALNDKATYEMWLRERYAAYVAAEGQIP